MTIRGSARIVVVALANVVAVFVDVVVVAFSY